MVSVDFEIVSAEGGFANLHASDIELRLDLGNAGHERESQIMMTRSGTRN